MEDLPLRPGKPGSVFWIHNYLLLVLLLSFLEGPHLLGKCSVTILCPSPWLVFQKTEYIRKNGKKQTLKCLDVQMYTHLSWWLFSCGMKKGLLWVFNLRLPKNYIELSYFVAEKKISFFMSRERESPWPTEHVWRAEGTLWESVLSTVQVLGANSSSQPWWQVPSPVEPFPGQVAFFLNVN